MPFLNWKLLQTSTFYVQHAIEFYILSSTVPGAERTRSPTQALTSIEKPVKIIL